MSDWSFNQYYEYSMYIALFGALLSALVFFWPSPKWVKESRRLDSQASAGEVAAAQDKRLLPALLKGVSILMSALILVAFLIFIAGMPPLFSFMLAVAIVAMIYPTISNFQLRREQRQGRKEALAVAEYVAGRMSAQAPLFEALENLYAEFLDGKRELEIIGEDLGEMIRNVRLGNDLGQELKLMAVKYEHLHSLRYVWTTYRLMAEASMGQEAEIFQANDLSESQAISEELASVLETEMSTATMSRITMFFLIGGMILFLVFFGEDLGRVLIETLPGNFVIGGALFALWLAQTVGSKLEELPSLEF